MRRFFGALVFVVCFFSTALAVDPASTSGFTTVTKGSGPPTGVPTLTNADSAPNYWDQTNSRLYVWSGGSWNVVTPVAPLSLTNLKGSHSPVLTLVQNDPTNGVAASFSGVLTLGGDVDVVRQAAGTLAVFNPGGPGNAAAVRIYNTADGTFPANAEWLEVRYDPNLADSGGWVIRPKASGTGVGRTVSMVSALGGAFVNLKGNDNMDLGANHIGISCPLAFDRSGYVIYYNGVALTGHGMLHTRVDGKFAAQSSLQTSIAAISGANTSPYFTDTAATLSVDVWVNIVTAGSSSLNETVTFTDDHGNPQTFTIPMTNAAGATTASPLTATGYYYGRALVRAKDYNGGSVVVVETGTSPTSHDGGAVISEIQGVP